MELLQLVALASFMGVLVGLALYVLMMNKQQGQQKPQQEPDEAAAVRQAQRPAAGVGRMRDLRQRRQRQAAQQQQQQAAASRGAESDASDSEDEDSADLPANRREQRRRERAEQREADAAAREARQNKINAYEERRRKKDEEREAREKAQEDEMRRAAEERQKAEDEEAAKWMSLISVEQTGTLEAAAAEEDQGLLGRFVDYIKQRKMVPIEEAATEFGLRSSEVVDRIQGLEAMGRLTGVMDDRGKFIYISKEEMEAVAAYVRRQGRISIAALAAQSNDLIDLEAKAAAGIQSAGPGPAIDFDAMVDSELVAVA